MGYGMPRHAIRDGHDGWPACLPVSQARMSRAVPVIITDGSGAEPAEPITIRLTLMSVAAKIHKPSTSRDGGI